MNAVPRATGDPVARPRAGARQWFGLAVLALPCLVYAMDLTVLNLAVPAMSAVLRPTGTQLLWIVDTYGFLVAGLLITMGGLGDRVGRRRVLLAGAAVFAVASLAAAFAPTAAALIAARALLGVAGATLAPSTLALIRTLFDDPRQRTFAISMWITSFSVGAAVGPLVGGALLEQFWWGSVFLPGVPVMVLLVVVGPVVLPEFRDPTAGRLDLRSALLALTAVLTVIWGLKHLAQVGLSWAAGCAVAAGIVVGGLFLRRQRRLADPLVDLGLFSARTSTVALGTTTMAFFVNFGSLLFIGQYLQLVLGLSPFVAGAWMTPSATGFVAGSMLTPTVLRVMRPSFAVAAGLALAAVGFGLLTQVTGGAGLAVVVTGSVSFAIGLAVVFTITTDLVVAAAPPEHAGAAAALSETGSELGGALGIAVLGALSGAVYRSAMTDTVDTVAAGVPPEAAHAAADTLGGAVATAAALPAPHASTLLDAARAAFVDGFQLAAAVSAALVVVAIALVLRYLRPIDTEQSQTSSAPPDIPDACSPTIEDPESWEAVR